MTRKQLPKAINRTGDNVHAFAGSIVPDEVAPEPAPRPAPTFNQIADEPALAVSSAPIANDSIPAASARPEARALPDQMAAKRRGFARKIIERHRTYAAVGGLMPLAIVNIASVTAVNLRMV
ncbi:MAG: hypothetical protein WBD90_09270, partial [Xanthobacteraceae bacterium]